MSINSFVYLWLELLYYTMYSIIMIGKDTEERRKTISRLRRVEGQIRGLQKMLEDERDMTELTQQFTAVKQAIDKAYINAITVYMVKDLKVRTKFKSEFDKYVNLLMRYS